jgi:electron-transferring-flavoprotein dehydrogenase
MDIEREKLEADVLFVGAGPACLAGAIQLQNQIEMHNEKADIDPSIKRLENPNIVIIEKGSEVGSHGISGAVLDPKALSELIPDWKELDDFPLEQWVEQEQMLVLSETTGFALPIMPPEFHDIGKPIVSIARFQKWMAEIATDRNIEIMTSTAGWDLLYNEEGAVSGVRTRDRGLDHDGSPKDEYEPGADIFAKVTIIGEGPRGTIARKLMTKYNLLDNNPITYEMGCKEVLQLPKGSVTKGFVYLTAGYPLSGSMGPINGTFGGAFIYSMSEDRVCIGLLAVLDAANPDQDVQLLLQRLKLHPKIKEIIGKGKVIKYGAKAVTVGGWGCMPKLYAPGALIVGDSASFLNAARIKGIHLAMKSGMLAADTAFEALLKNDFSEKMMKGFKDRVDASWIREEMQTSQNFHTDISTNGLPVGAVKYGLAKIFGPGSIRKAHEDHTGMKTLKEYYKGSEKRPEMYEAGKYTELKEHYKGVDEDDCYIVDKLTAVYLSGSIHDEHQPCHLRVEPKKFGFAADHCVTRCTEEYGNPCERFCPAQVYNVVEDVKANTGKRLQVDFSNCVHCKTCDIRDPYQIIEWVPPEGGDGPEYSFL